MRDFIFEVNKQNAYTLAEKHNITDYDRDYMRANYLTIIKVNNFDVVSIKEELNTLKNDFVKENTIFDLDIFNRENTEYLIFELNQYIDILKRGKVKTWNKYNDDFFHIFKIESELPEKILLISDKNITQLEIYFKTVLNTIQSFIEQPPLANRMKNSIRLIIQVQYKIGLETFLKTNYLANEVFYINYIDKNQKEQLQELEKEVSFFDISKGEKVTDDIADQWYNESITRDHYWFYKEYQIFLKERLAELEKTEQPQPDATTTEKYLGQPTNTKANDFFDFLIEYYRPEDKTQIKYVNILHYLKNDADKTHFIFRVKQSEYKIIVNKKTGIYIKKFAKSERYNEEEKPIFHTLENTFLKTRAV